MTFIAFFIGFGYAMVVLILAMESFTYKPKSNQNNTAKNELLGFTVMINFRNEQEQLPQLLASIARLSFAADRMQFLFINDDSTDNSLVLLHAFKAAHNHIDLAIYDRKPVSASSKKDGITQALKHAKYNHITTTDADCVLPETWLLAYEEHYSVFPESIFVAAPVQITAGISILEQLQASEMVALQLMAAGGFAVQQPFLCNGANMSFTKSHFYEVAGYDGNESIASGDDIFLLEKSTALNPRSCYYLKNVQAIVRTSPKQSWQEMVTQRARWAQKGFKTKSMLNKLMSAQVFAANLFVVLSPFLMVLDFIKVKAAITVLVLKLFTDLLILAVGYRFFENKYWKWFVLPQLLVYPFVVVAVTIESFTAVRWKGRVAAR
jgi:cellulose synthase/poly-beta-1,6-N-acetylglucosamine synthase-like glycosyltransferase